MTVVLLSRGDRAIIDVNVNPPIERHAVTIPIALVLATALMWLA